VLTFGQAWYREFSGVSEFSAELNFEAFLRNRPPSESALVAELDRALQTTGKGVTDLAYGSLVSGFSAQANGLAVADSIARYARACFHAT
jgi:hypothetical protein